MRFYFHINNPLLPTQYSNSELTDNIPE